MESIDDWKPGAVASDPLTSDALRSGYFKRLNID